MNSTQRLYEELALRYDLRQEARQRDIFLVLAADAALAAGHIDDAEGLRLRLLQLSPHNLLRPYASLTEALQSRDIQDYVAGLRNQFPPEQAETLLQGDNGKPEPKSGVTPVPAPIHRVQEEPVQPVLPPLPPARLARAQTPSPYERYDVPATPGQGDDSGGGWIALGLYFVVLVAALGLAAYVIVRPFIG
jgi:hypothetical protein